MDTILRLIWCYTGRYILHSSHFTILCAYFVESSEDQSTQQGYEDEEDGEYEESDEENF